MRLTHVSCMVRLRILQYVVQGKFIKKIVGGEDYLTTKSEIDLA